MNKTGFRLVGNQMEMSDEIIGIVSGIQKKFIVPTIRNVPEFIAVSGGHLCRTI